MNYFEQLTVAFLLLFLSNMLLKILFNKINYNSNIKSLIYDSLFISIIFLIWYIVLFFSFEKNFDLWLEIILILMSWIVFPFIYIYRKKKYLDNKKIKVSIYYPLIELLIIIISLWVVSFVL